MFFTCFVALPCPSWRYSRYGADRQCADLTLVSASDFTAANVDTQCVNRWLSTQRKKVSASNPTLYKLQQEAEAKAASESASSESSSTSSSSSSNSGLTVTEAGVVGSMVTLGTVLLVLTISYIAGLIGPGSNTKKGRQNAYAAEVSRSYCCRTKGCLLTARPSQ